MQNTLPENCFHYGMRIRGFSLGAQPGGHCAFVSHDNAPQHIVDTWNERDFRFGIVSYPAALSLRDIEHYSLTDLNIASDEELFATFSDFAKEMKAYDLSFDEFCADHIHPKGELRELNPLHSLPTPAFFALFKKQGFTPNLAGVKQFYSGL